jgi:hypothetical protein
MTQFEVSICFGRPAAGGKAAADGLGPGVSAGSGPAVFGSGDGKLDSDPTMEEHLATFKKVFEDMEQAVFKNQFLQFFSHDMNDLFFGKSSKFTRSIFENM